MHKIKKITTLILLLSVFVYPAFVFSQVVTFDKNLAWGSNDKEEVSRLQRFLSEQGLYKGSITGGFYKFTYNAVVAFQKKYGISPTSGYFATSTRLVANQILLSNSSIGLAGASISTSVSSSSSSVSTTSINQAVVSTNNNLVLNHSLEVVNGSRPDKWQYGKWGTNTAIFKYSTYGQDGVRSARIEITSYTSGDAKWFFDDVVVTPGAQYTFSEYYKSNVTTNVTVRWKKSDGTVTYQSLGNLPAASSWTLYSNLFTVPSGVQSMTIFHVLKSVGSLEIDNFRLIQGSILSPTDAVVSSWSSWAAVSQWSSCLNGIQSRAEERSRSIISPAVNGGVTPVLKETRVVSQNCITNTNTQSSSTLDFPIKEWGAYVGWQETAMDSFESVVGKQAKHRAVFIHWGNESAFPAYLRPYVKDKGKTLVIFWEATNYLVGTVNQTNYNYDSVLKGNFDNYFTKFANDAKLYGGEIILIPFSEMNGDWFPWSITQNGNTPQKHIDAWRKLHGFFKDVENVKFGWVPNHDSVPDTSINQFENFYPGDDYVDYVGLDGFNFGSPWMTFDQIFTNSINRMKVYKKPIYIFSFATASGVNKSSWITDALSVQIPKHPEIKGWIWFNESKERDWRVTADSSALSAFKASLP